ncbi:DNA (cytosine-5-)-methyltransferase [Nocardioides sp. WV_118_6]
MTELRAVEICAGAGGQSLGLHRAGFRHDLAVELDESAAATLRHNLTRLQGEAKVAVGDVADPAVWNPAEFREVDLLAGGVPCPPFSVAGKQLGSADERDLFAWAVELAGVVQPRALLLENVRGLSAPRFSGYRQAVADRLGELGYWSEWRLLKANEFGVPQLRPRFVLVAVREEFAAHFHWPEPTPTDRTVGSELRDLMASRGWRYADKWAEFAAGIAPTIVGGSKKHGGADLGPTRAKAAWAQLGVDGKGIANEAPDRNDPSFRTRMPRLTNEMVARLQGWNGPGFEWEFLGRKTSVYRQIGNAFPPPVAEAIGRAIADALRASVPRRDVAAVTEHDVLYGVLRGASAPVTHAELVALFPGDLDRRLDALERDFVLERSGAGSETRYVLGDFKAFRGQDDHLRHAVFASKATRSRVS